LSGISTLKTTSAKPTLFEYIWRLQWQRFAPFGSMVYPYGRSTLSNDGEREQVFDACSIA